MIGKVTGEKYSKKLKEPPKRIQAEAGGGTNLSVSQEEEKMREGWSTIVIDCRRRNLYHYPHKGVPKKSHFLHQKNGHFFRKRRGRGGAPL